MSEEQLAANRARHLEDLRAAEAALAERMRTHKLVADCLDCERTVGVHVPAGGDGTVVLTHWHKTPPTQDGTTTWCRTEIDSDLTRWDPR